MAAGWRFAALPAVFGLILGGCPDGDSGRDADDGGRDREEVADEEGDREEAEWGAECETDEDCADEIDCTEDTCDRGVCLNEPDDEACADDQVCNGEEVCDAREGCIPGAWFRGCNDADPCTEDVCLEGPPGMAPDCDHLPLDRDRDTHVDTHCPDSSGDPGDDCNDVDPLSYPGAPESCFDTFDNDCDTATDMDDPTCQMNFDSCASPRALEPGVEWEAFMLGATGDVSMSCDSPSNADVVFSFEVVEPSDVLVSVDARTDYVYVALQRECGIIESELRCTSSNQVSVFERGLAAGSYFVVVSSWDPGTEDDPLTFLVKVEITPAGPIAAGDICEEAIELTLPAHVEGDLTRMDDDYAPYCASWMDGADTVYTFELDEAQDVTVEASSIRASRYVSFQDACDDPGATVLFCDSGYPLHRRVGNVAAGRYYLWVDSQAPGTYTLDVSATDPTPPPENDACEGAVDISAGGRFEGSLISSVNDYDSCVFGWRDVAYVFTIEEAAGVSLVLRAHYDLWPYLVVTTECGNRAAELICQWYGSPTSVGWRDLAPGTYYVLVEADDEGTFELESIFSAPVDACGDLEVIEESATIRGSTSGAFDDASSTCGGTSGDDVAYEVRLAGESRVSAEITSASFDTVLYLRRDCDDAASQIVCNDDREPGDLTSLIDAGTLAAGSYYLFVDGLWSSGDYTLSVTIRPTGTGGDADAGREDGGGPEDAPGGETGPDGG
jgi:hypothetical protein